MPAMEALAEAVATAAHAADEGAQWLLQVSAAEQQAARCPRLRLAWHSACFTHCQAASLGPARAAAPSQAAVALDTTPVLHWPEVLQPTTLPAAAEPAMWVVPAGQWCGLCRMHCCWPHQCWGDILSLACSAVSPAACRDAQHKGTNLKPCRP